MNSIIDQVLNGTPVLFIGAHPDDEILIGPLLAFAADYSSAHVECVTLGESGINYLDCVADKTLAQVRSSELAKACQHLGVSFNLLSYINGESKAHPEGLAIFEGHDASRARWLSTGETRVSPETTLARWREENGDLLPKLKKLLAANPRSIVISFEPELGYSSHPEHKALPIALQQIFSEDPDALEHDVYWVLHHDQIQPSDICVSGIELGERGKRDYVETALEAEALHESQFGKIGSEENEKTIGSFRREAERMYLRPAFK